MMMERASLTYTFTIEEGEENIISDEGVYVIEETTEEESTVTSDLPEFPINHLTLINTSSDEAIGNFNSGAQIVAKDHRLSIVPDFGSEQPVEVKFELSGADNRTSEDNEFPFSLNGDDGNGNFWYGEGLYPGDYELVVTPYVEVDGELIAGASQNFTFSITEGETSYID